MASEAYPFIALDEANALFVRVKQFAEHIDIDEPSTGYMKTVRDIVGLYKAKVTPTPGPSAMQLRIDAAKRKADQYLGRIKIIAEKVNTWKQIVTLAESEVKSIDDHTEAITKELADKIAEHMIQTARYAAIAEILLVSAERNDMVEKLGGLIQHDIKKYQDRHKNGEKFFYSFVLPTEIDKVKSIKKELENQRAEAEQLRSADAERLRRAEAEQLRKKDARQLTDAATHVDPQIKQEEAARAVLVKEKEQSDQMKQIKDAENMGVALGIIDAANDEEAVNVKMANDLQQRFSKIKANPGEPTYPLQTALAVKAPSYENNPLFLKMQDLINHKQHETRAAAAAERSESTVANMKVPDSPETKMAREANEKALDYAKAAKAGVRERWKLIKHLAGEAVKESSIAVIAANDAEWNRVPAEKQASYLKDLSQKYQAAREEATLKSKTAIQRVDVILSEWKSPEEPVTPSVTESEPPATDADPPATDADPPATDADPSATDADPSATEADPVDTAAYQKAVDLYRQASKEAAVAFFTQEQIARINHLILKQGKTQFEKMYIATVFAVIIKFKMPWPLSNFADPASYTEGGRGTRKSFRARTASRPAPFPAGKYRPSRRRPRPPAARLRSRRGRR